MFAQIYNTAKRILSRSPSVQGRSSEARDTPPTSNAHGIEVTMVTTRRGTETPGQEATPRSSAKRKVGKRELEALDTPTAVKKQKRSTPKKAEVVKEAELSTTEDAPIQESTEDTSDTIAVAASSTDTLDGTEHLPIRRRSSPQVIVANTSPPALGEADSAEEVPQELTTTPRQEDLYQTPEQRSSPVYTTPLTLSKAEGSPTPRAKRANERSSAKKSSARENHVDIVDEYSFLDDEIPSSTYESEQAPITSQDSAIAPSQSNKAHRRFDSEEPAETQDTVTMNLQGNKHYEVPETTDKVEVEVAAQEDDDASDSDEAPEIVTTTAATQKAKASEQDTARALLAQQEKEQNKREAREKRIAHEQAGKRKREEKKAKKLAKRQAAMAQPEPEVDLDAPTSHLSIDRNNLPALLPTSLLSTLPDQRAPTPPPSRSTKTAEELRKEKLNHHIKFLERTDKGVKDVKKGKLSVAVLGQQNKVLPPKVNRHSRSVRETWLKGRQVEARKGKGIGGKMERRGFGNKGFTRGDD